MGHTVATSSTPVKKTALDGAVSIAARRVLLLIDTECILKLSRFLPLLTCMCMGFQKILQNLPWDNLPCMISGS